MVRVLKSLRVTVYSTDPAGLKHTRGYNFLLPSASDAQVRQFATWIANITGERLDDLRSTLVEVITEAE